MVLYTCVFGSKLDIPGPVSVHYCANAAKALRQAGHSFEVQAVGGMKGKGSARDAIEELSGQRRVPVLQLDDGTVIAGSKEIIAWAKATAGAATEAA